MGPECQNGVRSEERADSWRFTVYSSTHGSAISCSTSQTPSTYGLHDVKNRLLIWH